MKKNTAIIIISALIMIALMVWIITVGNSGIISIAMIVGMATLVKGLLLEFKKKEK